MDSRHPAALAALSVCEMSWKRAKIISGEEFQVDLKTAKVGKVIRSRPRRWKAANMT